MKVVIDPGHGGRDPGAIGPSGVQEKVVTLAVALKLAGLLRNNGVEVLLTRDVDKHLGEKLGADLYNRAKIANQSNAAVFVSIHGNSAENRSAQGVETHCYPGSREGRLLAEKLQSHLVLELGLHDRGVKESNFAVLRETQMPAALVELAFISNPTEEALLETDRFQEKCARAIASGILKYLGIKEEKPVEDWKQKIVEDAKAAGLLNQDHDPNEKADKWFVLAVALNLLKAVKG